MVNPGSKRWDASLLPGRDKPPVGRPFPLLFSSPKKAKKERSIFDNAKKRNDTEKEGDVYLLSKIVTSIVAVQGCVCIGDGNDDNNGYGQLESIAEISNF